MHGYAYRGKRLLDVSILIMTAPLTLPVIAITTFAVLVFDGRPVLFKQERAGLNGAPFRILKFRTMAETAKVEIAGLSRSEQITESDKARITNLGRFLRKTSLDELPQLINVARREMSLVGPRPLFTRYIPYYTERERSRLSVMPGITGHSQVSHRNNGGWRKRLEMDAAYVEEASPALDLRILAMTVVKALHSENVSVVAGDTGDALDDERSFPHEEGIHMRRLYARDLDTRVAWLRNPEVSSHLSLDGPITRESTSKWYSSIRQNQLRRDYSFEKSDGTLVAMSGIRAIPDKKRTEFYVFVSPEHQGRRIGSIATKLTLAECRETELFKNVWLTVRKENFRATKIYERLGFAVCEESDDRFSMEIDLST